MTFLLRFYDACEPLIAAEATNLPPRADHLTSYDLV
jgi:hypothetical protein